jgi:hypothetical protein
LVGPTNNSVQGTTPVSFTVTSPIVNTPLNIKYLLEMSTTSNFAKGTVTQVSNFISNTAGTQGLSSSFNLAQIFPNAAANTTIYWRYGVRNTFDNPGPHPDFLTGERYIFSNYFTFTFSGPPPPPPKGRLVKHNKKG